MAAAVSDRSMALTFAFLFKKGLRDGHGIYQYADGGRYEGGWEGKP